MRGPNARHSQQVAGKDLALARSAPSEGSSCDEGEQIMQLLLATHERARLCLGRADGREG